MAFSAIISLWRFPHLILENGGGVFLLIYLVLAFAVGGSLIVAETILIRYLSQKTGFTDGSLITLFPLSNKSFGPNLVSKSITAISLIGLAYLLVLSAIILSSGIEKLGFLKLDIHFSLMFTVILSVFIFLLINTTRLKKHIHEGLSVLCPLLLAFLTIVFVKSLGFNSTLQSIRKEFYPDFRGVSYISMLDILGQIFVSLGLGLGIIFRTRARYESNTVLVESSFIKVVFSIFISMSACILVFPMIDRSTLNTFGTDLWLDLFPRFLKYISGSDYLGLFFLFLLDAIILLVASSWFQSINQFKTLANNTFWPKWNKSIFLALAVIGLVGLFLLFGVGSAGFYLIDKIIFSFLVPLAVLMTIYLLQVTLREVDASSRLENTKTEMSKVFFVIIYFTPILILLAFALKLI